MQLKDNSSYKSIFKSTSIVGGSQVINILFKALRKKILALLIGASGLGLFGLYTSIINLVMQFSNLGLGTACVKEIAKNNSNKDDSLDKVVKIVVILFIITGIIGTLIMFIVSNYLSQITFGDITKGNAIRCISIVLFFNTLSLGLGSVVQGLRKIKKLALISIFSSFSSFILSTIIIYFYREDGIILSIITVAAINFIIYYKYFKSINLHNVRITLKEFYHDSFEMVKFGLTFMSAGIVASLSIYLINTYLNRKYGAEYVGYYQAAIGLSSLYVGMVLQAMGKDFYPRLAMTVDDNQKSIRTINEQVEVGILVSIPGLLITFIFAPFVISLFYSSDFFIAYKILRWVILGIFIRVISWPLGYYLIARGEGKLYFVTELIFNTLNLMLIVGFTKLFGITGSGVAFSIQYIFYLFFMKRLIKNKCGYQWSSKVRFLIIIFTSIILLYFLLWLYVDNPWSAIIMICICIVTTGYSIKEILILMEINSLEELKFNIKKIMRKI